MPSSVAIRPISAGDVAGFHRTLSEVCRERRFLAMLEPPTLESAELFVARNISLGAPQMIAVDSGEVIGWCDILPGDANLGTAHVGRLGMGVLRSRRGQGIGRRLAEAALAAAGKFGYFRIELEVFATNSPALALYRKLGFVEEGRRLGARVVDNETDDLVMMALPLAAR